MRKYVIQRQGGYCENRLDALVGIGFPNDGLLYVVDHVAVTEHRALRYTGRTTGILQISNVCVSDIDFVENLSGTGLQCLSKFLG